MDKKIAAIRAAFEAQDAAKLQRAAKAVMAHAKRHPMCAIVPGVSEIEALCRKITAVPECAITSIFLDR